uniref:Uncharacterized protein n=1 Tax=Magallana gigas TaxID=29159 RepID=K1QMH6_MAGGI
MGCGPSKDESAHPVRSSDTYTLNLFGVYERVWDFRETHDVFQAQAPPKCIQLWDDPVLCTPKDCQSFRAKVRSTRRMVNKL